MGKALCLLNLDIFYFMETILIWCQRRCFAFDCYAFDQSRSALTQQPTK